MTESDEATALSNLLAIIHRDGGHHTAEVGLEQSVKDAVDRVTAARQIIYEAKSRLNMLYDSPDADLLEVIGRLLASNAASYQAEDTEERLRAALRRLVEAVTDYQTAHDHRGDGSMQAGRCWMLMSRAVTKAKELC